MIVYLLLHEPSEMCYVGSTELTVEERFDQHWTAKRQSDSPLYAAMKASKKRDWTLVVLDEYDDLETMLRGEAEWMLELETVRPLVGFNSQVPREASIQAALKRVGLKGGGPKRTLSEEDIEAYRAAGARGGEATNRILTREQRAAHGRKGAEAKWSRPGAKERASEAARSRPNTWWESLTEEQKEEHRRKGREAGKNNKK